METLNPITQILERAKSNPEHVTLFSHRLKMDSKTFADTVKRVAARLRSAGLRPGQVVALKLEPEMQAIFVAAVMHEAAVSLAANKTIVENYSNDIDFVISNSHEWQSISRKFIYVDDLWLESLAAVNHRIEPNNFASEHDLALLVFSSGTTGIPKGVEFSVSDILHRTSSSAKNWLLPQPFFCELGLDTVSGIIYYFYSLLNSQTYYVPSNAENNLEIIKEAGIVSIKTSPAKLVDLVNLARKTNTRLDAISQLLVVGGLLSPNTAEDLSQIGKAELHYLYGSTEAGSVTRGKYKREDPENVGTVIDGVFLSIVDDNGQEVSNGTIGELRMKTPYQSKKYWLLEPDGKAGFNDGWFSPGDAGVLDEDNQLRVTGRLDELINTAGTKLNPAVIDSKLIGYRGIDDLASFGYRSEGQIQKRLGIAIVTTSEISMENFRKFLLDVVPEANDFAIVQVPEIPRNALGKPLRMELAAMYEAHGAL
jgi:acyl-coenzyme A synthetase/AMP-(fatty) acid ligase